MLYFMASNNLVYLLPQRNEYSTIFKSFANMSNALYSR